MILKTFLISVSALSITLAVLFHFLGVALSSAQGMAFLVAYMFSPLVSVVLTDLIHEKKFSLRKYLNKPRLNRYFFLAWLFPLLLAGLTIVVSLLVAGTEFLSDGTGIYELLPSDTPQEQILQLENTLSTLPIPLPIILIIQVLIAGLTINALAAFGEEIAWRGFLVKEFSGMSFMKASLVIGTLWGLWHAPVILLGHNYPSFPIIGVVMMSIWCILLTPIFLYTKIKTNSLITSCILHGTINAAAGIPMIYTIGGSELITGLTGLTVFVALIILTGIVYLHDIFKAKDLIFHSTI